MSTNNGHAPIAAGPPPLAFLYRNHRGEVSMRRVRPSTYWYGVAEWHPGEQWLLDAFDCDKGAYRTFAVGDIIEWFGMPTARAVAKRCLCGAIDPADCGCQDKVATGLPGGPADVGAGGGQRP